MSVSAADARQRRWFTGAELTDPSGGYRIYDLYGPSGRPAGRHLAKPRVFWQIYAGFCRGPEIEGQPLAQKSISYGGENEHTRYQLRQLIAQVSADRQRFGESPRKGTV